jgi:hypothetical protein
MTATSLANNVSLVRLCCGKFIPVQYRYAIDAAITSVWRCGVVLQALKKKHGAADLKSVGVSGAY